MCGRVHSPAYKVFGSARKPCIARAMPGFGLPLSKEGMKLPNQIGGFKQTQGTETSQYLEERTSTETPLVVASERGPGQWRTRDNRNSSGKLDLRGGQSRTGQSFVRP